MTDHQLALVIEDDLDASFIFTKALEANGFVSEHISEGDKAVKRLQEVVPALILLDLHLPNVNGREILQIIQADKRLVNAQVVIVSADPRMAEELRNQVDLVLLKPTTFTQVRDFTARLIQRNVTIQSNSSKSEAQDKIVVPSQPTDDKT